MSYNTKNYTEQGGEKTVINGELSVTGVVKNPDGDVVNLATQVALQAASEATTVAAVKDDLNALIAKLKAAGVMAAE